MPVAAVLTLKLDCRCVFLRWQASRSECRPKVLCDYLDIFHPPADLSGRSMKCGYSGVTLRSLLTALMMMTTLNVDFGIHIQYILGVGSIRTVSNNCYIDEAPLTCEVFVDEGGMEIFLKVLEVWVMFTALWFCWLLDTWRWWAQQQKLSCTHIWPVCVESVLERIRWLRVSHMLRQRLPTITDSHTEERFPGDLSTSWNVNFYRVSSEVSEPSGKTTGCRHVPFLSISYTFQSDLLEIECKRW